MATNKQFQVRFAEQGKIVTFRIGDRKSVMGPNGKPVFGVLGSESFAGVDFELDFSRGKLNFFSQDHCPGRVVYWADDWGSAPLLVSKLGTFYFPVELEGQKVEATFASAEPLTRLTTDVAKRLYGFDEKSPGVEVEVLPGYRRPVAHYRAMQLTAPEMLVKNVHVRLAKRPSGVCPLLMPAPESGAVGYDCNSYPMALGRNVLSKLRLYFALRERKLYFTLADRTFPQAPAEAAGEH